MRTRPIRPLLDLTTQLQKILIEGAHDTSPVRGLTHGFYKYPARFSPAFARAAIEAFTVPNDFVLDNHVGGGTTLVEALSLGRNALGVDISALAEFVSAVKTNVFNDTELKKLSQWAMRVPNAVNMHKSSNTFSTFEELGYYKHFRHTARWRLRKAIEQSLRSAIYLKSPRLVAFGRCVVLRTAQWALDGRKYAPSIDEFRDSLSTFAFEMIAGARELKAVVTDYPQPLRLRIINRSAVGIESDKQLNKFGVPKLVLTSPPYPGVHVLYHRWQVEGGKEAPMPFLIANRLDGAGSSYYTMGDRHYPALKTYFDNIRASMSSIAALADQNTTIVQMVAFSDASWQLPRYLETMEEAGLTEMFLPALASESDGRLWRTVPGRRWYSDQRGCTPGSQEVVLIHRKKRAVAKRSRRQPRIVAHNPHQILAPSYPPTEAEMERSRS